MLIRRMNRNVLIERTANGYDVTWANITKNCTLVGSKLVPGSCWVIDHISIGAIWLDRAEFLSINKRDVDIKRLRME